MRSAAKRRPLPRAGQGDPRSHRHQCAVSGFLTPSGNEALILLAIHRGLLRPCLSEEIIDEYSAVLGGPKFAFPPDEIEALIAMLRRNGELFQPEESSTSPDAGDTKFIDCALTAGADFIVTGNKRHFPNPTYGSARVVNAGELLDRITLGLQTWPACHCVTVALQDFRVMAVVADEHSGIVVHERGACRVPPPSMARCVA